MSMTIKEFCEWLMNNSEIDVNKEIGQIDISYPDKRGRFIYVENDEELGLNITS